MRTLLIAAAAGLSLAGCSTTSQIDTAIQKNLPAVCQGASTAHIAFVAVAATGRVSERTMRREQAAYDALAPLCVDPSKATTAAVLVAAVNAYATITVALREAEKAV